MLLQEILSLIFRYWPLILTLSVLSYLLNNKYGHGINQYPGPSLAGYSNWWRFFDVLGRHAQHTQILLHRDLGDIVRLGPNALSFANPKAIKEIYGLNKGYTKV